MSFIDGAMVGNVELMIVKKIKIKLPAKIDEKEGYLPDWSYMNDFIEKLEYADNL